MELAFELITHPESALQKIKEGAGLKEAFAAMAAAWLCLLLGAILFLNLQVSGPGFLKTYILGGLLILIVLPLKTAVLHFSAKLLGGRGRARSLLSMLGYCLSPWSLLLPLALLLHRAAPFLGLPIVLGIASWTGVLGFKAIKRNYHLGDAKSVLVGLAPAGCFALLCAGFIALALGILAAKLLLAFQ